MSKHDKLSVDALVREVLENDLEGAILEGVSVEEGFDSDGDEILRILVVIGDGSRKLNAHKVSATARHLISRLSEINELRFPLISFASKREAQELKGEAA